MNVLGISCYYHDAAAALVSDGRVIAAVEEERFTRRKHDHRFPREAIDYCLREGRISVDEIDLVCFYEKPLRKLERVLMTGLGSRPISEPLLSRQLGLAIHEQLFLDKVLRRTIGYRGPLVYSEHHLSHAASAFYPSPFAEAAILTVDGVGEWATTQEAIGEGKQIRKLREIRYPHSLGLLYSALTAFLGFKPNSDEYKVMGLAAYGEPKLRERVRKLVKRFPDASIALDMDYFSFDRDTKRMYSDLMVELLGTPRNAGDPITDRDRDLAASLQAVLEEDLLAMTEDLYKQTAVPNLCLAGGVALNGVANARILRDGPFRQVWVQPAAGDAGGALGAALLAYYAQPGTLRNALPSHDTLLGPSFGESEIISLLKREGANYTEFRDEETLYSRVAELIHRNRIIGWFQGRVEFGPRALGNRSILANPCNPDMQHILNARIKFREDFRPFAPAVLEECAERYFDCDSPSPYMLFVFDVKHAMRSVLPAVTHVDGSARVQTVNRRENPRFYRLIEAFGKRSGVPVLINTSFNVRGEPIVCTPEDAYRCFMKTDIDYLVLDRFLVEKEV